MKRYLFIILVFFIVKASAQPYILSGTVEHRGTNLKLSGANVLLLESNQGVSSDSTGHFTIQVKNKGQHTLRVSFLGYSDYEQKIEISGNLTVQVTMDIEQTQLTEITVIGNRTNQTQSNPQTGIQKLSMKDIRMLPKFMGDSDPVKAIRLTPGVQAGGEGNEGLFVRGSDPGQNLILLEDMPIYNASHLLGLYSVFNPSIVKNVTLYKGAYPALYGGRSSSLLKIGLTDGISDKSEFEGSIGFISSRASVKTPILKNNASLLVAGRITYLQLLKSTSEMIGSKVKYLENNMYNFGDLNLRLEFQISPKNRLILNSYLGSDKYELTRSLIGMTYNMDWGNRVATIKHIHIFNSNTSWTTIIGVTNYFFNLDANYQQYGVKLKSELTDPFFRTEFFYSHNNHFFQFGLETTLHSITPESADVQVNSSPYTSHLKFRSREVSVFANDTWTVNDHISVMAGVRATSYTHLGAYNTYLKNAYGEVTDTLRYGFNDPVKTYYGVEPRFSLSYKRSQDESYKLSLSRNYQYMHLISVGSVSFPTDIWFPSTKHVKPEYTDQIALGYYRSLKNNLYDASVELYFRQMQNVIEFTNSLTATYEYNEFEESVTHGKGYSFGAEWHIRKNIGSFSGWISYTLGYTIRKFDDINNGQFFFGKYDRRHDLALTLQYKLSEHWDLSSVFIYSTGNAMTLPTGRYMIQGQIVNDYTSVNSFRMPAYH
ncbi:MAG TPA: carboxypeptidase-like regulatory domain-containing protein, partial [Tenuifilaceae bacterium]|nr:carboxypeptidase-like regulatory domain-containing protein [Tenuifilaceae bacterium]